LPSILESASYCRFFEPGPRCDFRPPAPNLVSFLLVVGPPALALIIGAALGAIAAGFKRIPAP
jgi:hypothetical protein